MTTDDTGTITNAWRNVDTTVTLSPSDGTGAGLVQTYYTTNGVNPTTGSPTGTSILLTAEGTYTIKYFSTDRVANTEAVKTGAAQIRIDKTNPTSATLNALPAAIRNGQSLTGGGADALSGVGSITYLYCAGAACTPSTVVGSSSTPAGGYPVTWNGQPADGTYRVRARVFDAAGNQLDSAIQTVTIDNTNPTGAVTAPAAAANVRGSSVSVTSNSADGGSGVANALFQRSPAGAGTWTTIGAADTSTPYGVTWDTTAVTDGLYDLRVVTTDNAGNTFTSTTIANVRVDNTNPTGAVTAPAAAANVRGSSVSVTSNSADPAVGGSASGVANALFQRSPAGAGTWTTIGAADTSTPYGVTWDTTAVTDGLYDLRVVTTDNAGNTFTSTTIANVRVDNTVPTQSLALTGVAPAGSAFLSGTNLFYRGAAAGQLRIRNTVADGGSGPASSTTSALGGTSTGWTHTAGTVSTPAGGPYDSNLFSWSAGTTSSPTVDLYGTDAAGNNSATATLTLRNDTTAPTGGALTVNGVAASAGGTTSNSNGSFTIGVRTDWTETATPTASGLASSTLTRDSASYTNNACGLYSGSPTTIVGAPAQNLTVGCYRYVLTGTDNVGNVVSIQTDVLVHGAATQIVLTGSTANLTSGATRVLTATVRDANGNTVVSDNSTVINFAKQSGAGTVTGTGTATASAGVATKTITGALVGSVTMEATAGGLTTGTLGAFTVVHGAAADIVADGLDREPCLGHDARAHRDAAGRGRQHRHRPTTPPSSPSPSSPVPAPSPAPAPQPPPRGVATKTITGALIGSVTMEATAAGLTTGTLGAFTVVHGAAAQIALTGATTNLTSGATRVLTATIQDAAGNTVTADNTTVVTFAKQSGAGTVTGTGTATAASGVATKTITGALVGPVVMEATAAGLTTGTLGSFTVVHGAAADIVLTGATTNLTSGATRVLTATIRDAAGNTVTSRQHHRRHLRQAVRRRHRHRHGHRNRRRRRRDEDDHRRARRPGRHGGHGPGSHHRHARLLHRRPRRRRPDRLTGATTNLTSGATRVLTATIQDAAGNTVTADSTTVVTFAKQSGAGTVTGTGTATAASGVATKTITGALVGPVVMEATAAGLTTGTLGSFTVVHGAASQIALTGSTANLTSGATRVLTATIQDAAGNTVTAGQHHRRHLRQSLRRRHRHRHRHRDRRRRRRDEDDHRRTRRPRRHAGHGHGSHHRHARLLHRRPRRRRRHRADGLDGEPGLGHDPRAHGNAAGRGRQHGHLRQHHRHHLRQAVRRRHRHRHRHRDRRQRRRNEDDHRRARRLGHDGSHRGRAHHRHPRRLHRRPRRRRPDRAQRRDHQPRLGRHARSDGDDSGRGRQHRHRRQHHRRHLRQAVRCRHRHRHRHRNRRQRCRDQDDHRRARRLGHDGSHRSRAHHRHPRRLHRRPRRRRRHRAHRRHHQPCLRRHPRPHRHDPGRRRQHRHLRQHDRRSPSPSIRRRHRHRHRHRDRRRAASPPRRSPAPSSARSSMEATALGLTTGTLGAFTVVHGAATQIALTGATTNLTSGATRVLTATIQDAAGNTVTADSSTVITFAKQSGAGTVTGTGTATADDGVATKTITGALVGSVTMEATAAGLTTGTLGAFTVVHGAATQIALTGSTANLTSGATRVLTATIHDAAGNTVTSDSTTVITFAKQSGAGTVTGTGTATVAERRRDQDDHRRPRRLGHDGSHRRRPHHRHPRRLHRRPRRRRRHRPHRRDHQPHLRRDPRPDRDDPGRRRQHRHRRQLDRHHLRQGLRRGHGHRHRQRDRGERRRDQDDHRRARRLGHDGGDRGSVSPPARSAPSPSSTAPPPRSRSPARPPTSPPARRGS